jgi:predicted nucleotidyltransferase
MIKQVLLSKLKELKVELTSKYPISSLAVFGSVARGDNTEESDLDILIEFNGQIGGAFIDLANDLEQRLGKKVDLVSRAAIKPHYFKEIEQDLIYV